MTDKQERFCLEYAKDLDPVRAYMAVYQNCRTERTASAAAARLLANVSVAARVRELKAVVAERALISAEDVIRDIIAVKDRCMQAVPVQVWDKDAHAYVDSDAEYTFDSRGANAALKMLGEYVGLFEKKVRVTTGEEEKDKLDAVLKQLGMLHE